MVDNYFKIKKGLVVYGDTGLLFSAGLDNTIKIGEPSRETLISIGANLFVKEVLENNLNNKLLSIDNSGKIFFTNKGTLGFVSRTGNINETINGEKIFTDPLEVSIPSNGTYLKVGSTSSGELNFYTSSSVSGVIGAKHTISAISTNGEIAFATASNERYLIDRFGNHDFKSGNMVTIGNVTANNFIGNLNGQINTSFAGNNTIVSRNGNGDIRARLFRSEFGSTNPTIGFIMTQIDTGSNNFIRPSTPAQFRDSVTDGNYLSVSGGILDGGTNTTLTLRSNDTGISTINLIGDSQGSGMFYAGQSSSYGGGLEYNGDGSSTTGSGQDNVTLFRRNNNIDYWTARNSVSTNDWEFRGDVTAKNYFDGSDKRLKTDIKKISKSVYSYELKTQPGITVYGTIAQEIEKTNPEVVKKPKDGEMMSVNYNSFLSLKLAEQENENKEQNNKIDSLQQQIDELKELIKNK